MTAKQVLHTASLETFGEGDGTRYRLELDPGFSEEELKVRELGLRAPPVPDEIRELLLFCRGLTLGEMSVDLWGFSCPLDDLFPCGRVIGAEHEAAYVSWTVDINQRTGEWGPVFYTPDDTPEVILVAQTVGEFLLQIIETHRARRDYDPLAGAPRPPANLQSRDAAVASHDPVTRAFAEELEIWGPLWRIADLRGLRPGSGFSWAEYGPGTVVRRYGSELLFAVIPPPRQRSKGFIRRLFGRRGTDRAFGTGPGRA